MRSSFSIKIVALLIGFLFPLVLLSQDCPPGGLLIKTSLDISTFKNEYPNCKKINGTLTIGWPNKVVQSLSGLSQLEEVVGNLTIGRSFYTTTSFSNLGGLQNIKKVGGDLNIIHNTELSDISALDNLDSIGKNLEISQNESLSNCTAISICDFIDNPTGSIDIHSNKTGCNNIIEVASGCNIELECLPYGNYYLVNQMQVDSFQSDFPNCGVIHGDLNINGSDINNLEGLSHIISIEGSLKVMNTSVLDLQGLRNLESIGGYLFVTGNHQITNLEGFDNLAVVNKAVRVEDNNSLLNLVGFQSLTTVGYDFYIRSNSSLKSVEGLNNLETVGQEGLIIASNDSLTSLMALKNLVSTPGLSISDNPLLTSLKGIDNIVADSIGWVSIRENTMLSECEVKSICDLLIYQQASVSIQDNAVGCNSISEVITACDDGGFTFVLQSQIDEFQSSYPDLSSIEGHVRISGNDITSLEGLNSITSIGSNLTINSNPVIPSLYGLENLTTIEGQLSITKNDMLTDISGIASIEANTIDTLVISENPLLDACDVSSICDYLVEQNGYSVIEQNFTGCNSVSEVAEVCYEWLPDATHENKVGIFPNPAENEINIICKSDGIIGEVWIYNYTGQTVFHNEFISAHLDISALKKGFYIVEVVLGNTKYRQKIIIQ